MLGLALKYIGPFGLRADVSQAGHTKTLAQVPRPAKSMNYTGWIKA